MNKYLYTLRVEFEAADDVAARERMQADKLSLIHPTDQRLDRLLASAKSDDVIEKLQRLQDTQPPKLVEWYR